MFRLPAPVHQIHIRTPRASRPDLNLSQEELVEIRASQRTFEGAYFRTSISLFTFSLIILKVFTFEFYPIGALFAGYGAVIMAISAYRRSESNRQFYIVEDKEENELPVDQRRGAKRVFRTSGNTVIVCAITSVIAYIILIYLVLRLNVDPKASRKPSKQIQNLSGAIALGST
ncbi:hypothetical protein TWF173_003537 [Orbilia oligospora]|uniref:DUF202 domain-containing protein n=2 Tax=Orbilia oligospora TaxID=2813651 RepID=G1X603_ARTOA|nr:hypothetical protein AOL_s00054g297 [Orbilia oligospora ATCC 24927]EGX51598.1 hypothetical protein AOL_s00054g297 [Orbilia oligospora ATCC 24927]KAF3274715.1 hypothetical protein TWF970_007699 [Orbilia oligospora]KAF3319084.1 hypothetical protein TWF173_003537 [Orbilia oligospora]